MILFFILAINFIKVSTDIDSENVPLPNEMMISVSSNTSSDNQLLHPRLLNWIIIIVIILFLCIGVGSFAVCCKKQSQLQQKSVKPNSPTSTTPNLTV